jgi:hypothetical protein
MLQESKEQALKVSISFQFQDSTHLYCLSLVCHEAKINYRLSVTPIFLKKIQALLYHFYEQQYS